MGLWHKVREKNTGFSEEKVEIRISDNKTKKGRNII